MFIIGDSVVLERAGVHELCLFLSLMILLLINYEAWCGVKNTQQLNTDMFSESVNKWLKVGGVFCERCHLLINTFLGPALFLASEREQLRHCVNFLIQKIVHLVSSFSGMLTSLQSCPFVPLINLPSDAVSVQTVRYAADTHPAAGSQLKFFMSYESHLHCVSFSQGCVYMCMCCVAS